MEDKPKEFALEYAGFWLRLGATIVDLTTLGFIAWITTYFFSASIIWIVLGVIISTMYFLGFWTWRGQTPGKIVAGIKIIRTDSSPVTWRHSILRYLGYIVSTMILFIGFIWIAFDSHKQGIHDKIADTYVVKLPVRQVVLTESYAQGRFS